MNAAFVICTEPAFEKKSVLLVRSIRKFGGTLSSAPVYSFSPRKDHAISNWAEAEFSRLGVEHSNVELNMRYTKHGVYNKPFVCAYTEHRIPSEHLIFLDSDQVIFNDPKALLIEDDYVAAVRPVNQANIGVSALVGGKNEKYWNELYQLCGVRTRSMVSPMLSDREIFAYFNTGMISIRRNSRAWSRWAANFERVMEMRLEPSEPYFIEQSVFAATVSSMNKPIALLPPNYNYPLPAHHALSDRLRIASFEEAVSIHYFRAFNDRNWFIFLEHLPHFDRQSERYDWLIQTLSELAL